MEKFECADCGVYYWTIDRNDFDCPNCETSNKIMVEIIDNFDDHVGYKKGTILEVVDVDDDCYLISKEGYFMSEAEIDFVNEESEINYYKTIINIENEKI